ncbi:hypothetical protein REPUB_Repub08aG0132700 [Reevesia pubescens]
MGAPSPAFIIRHPGYAMSDNVTPFRDYDYFGPLWDPVPFVNSKQTFEEWTTNELITFEQIEEYGTYYVGDRSDMYAISHFVYYVKGQYMPVFRKITGNDMITDCRWMRIKEEENRRGYGAIRPRAFPRPVCVNPQPGNSHEQLKRLEIVINVEGVKINPNPNETSPIDGNDYMEEDGNGEEGIEGEEEEVSFWQDEIIEDYFSESPGFDDN